MPVLIKTDIQRHIMKPVMTQYIYPKHVNIKAIVLIKSTSNMMFMQGCGSQHARSPPVRQSPSIHAVCSSH